MYGKGGWSRSCGNHTNESKTGKESGELIKSQQQIVDEIISESILFPQRYIASHDIYKVYRLKYRVNKVKHNGSKGNCGALFDEICFLSGFSIELDFLFGSSIRNPNRYVDVVSAEPLPKKSHTQTLEMLLTKTVYFRNRD